MTDESGPDTASQAVVMEQVEKYYGDFHALKNINLDVAKGEKIVLCLSLIHI